MSVSKHRPCLSVYPSGYETARSLAYHGCRVVFACRNLESANTAIETIKSERANSVCEVIHCDLADLASVRAAAAEFHRRYRCVCVGGGGEDDLVWLVGPVACLGVPCGDVVFADLCVSG